MKKTRRSVGSDRLEESEQVARQLRCEHKEEAAKEIITLRGRTAIVKAWRCIKCGEVSMAPEEVERARKELNPSVIHRFKEFFGIVEERAEADRKRHV